MKDITDIEFDTDKMDEALNADGLDWTFRKPSKATKYSVVYVIEKQEESESESEDEMCCDICGGDKQVGYVDDPKKNTFKVCEDCDVDGSNYNGWKKDEEDKSKSKSDFDKAELVWQYATKLGFDGDVTFNRIDGGCEITMECEEELEDEE